MIRGLRIFGIVWIWAVVALIVVGNLAFLYFAESKLDALGKIRDPLMARPAKKKRAPAVPPAASKILPMELRAGDRLSDETAEWEVIGRPYTVTGGKYARVRVQMFGQPAICVLKTWGAHERISVKRTISAERKR